MRPSHRLIRPDHSRGGSVRAALALLFAALLVSAAPLAAQAGRIAGRVVNAQGEGVASAQVNVAGTQVRVSTDVEGRYTLAGVPQGTHSVTVTALSYSSKTVTGVVVAEGRTAELNVSLAPAALMLTGVTVTAQAERGSTGALLSERRNSASVVDAIGAEQMSQTPDGDAAAVVRRVPGVSVVDGRFVYVRGLGERYGNTTLNGAVLSSPIPDRKAVPLDIIPTALLESVITAKTYSPDQPGDYAGGLVQIETRAAPTERVFRLSSGMGWTQGETGSAALGYPAGNLLGFGGAMDLPAGLPRDAEVNGLPADAGARESVVRGISGPHWGPVGGTLPANGSLGVSFGDEVDAFGKPLGLMGTFSWASGASQPADRAERFFGVTGGAPERQTDLSSTATARETTVGALLNGGIRLSDTDRVTATLVYNHLAEAEARSLSGFYANRGPFLDQTRLRYVENTLANAQLRGQHLLPFGDATLRWRLPFSFSRRYEPGTRTTVYASPEEGEARLFQDVSESGQILHQDLEDRGWNPGVDLKLPAGFLGSGATLSVGGSADVRDRTVYARRIRVRPIVALGNDDAALAPNELFAAANFGDQPGQLTLDEATFAGDNYDSDFSVFAGYLMADFQLLPRLRVAGGARVEQASIATEAVNRLNRVEGALPRAELENVDLLPGINLTYELTPDMNLRAAASRTVARPQFRELAPYLYVDYFGGSVVVGNPYLRRTSIINTDLRWEWFLGTGSVLAASAFHKRFDDPIEPLALVLGTNPAQTYANGDRAELYGAELEARTNLGRLLPALQEFSVNANVTLVHSRTSVGQTVIYRFDDPLTPDTVSASSRARPLFGQSPYVVNAGLTWDGQRSGTTATVLFNRFGRRLDAFGGLALPDVYEEGRTQLDLTVEQQLPRGFEMKLSATRLLGQEVRYTQSFPNGDTVTTRQYDLGRAISLSLSWEPGR